MAVLPLALCGRRQRVSRWSNLRASAIVVNAIIEIATKWPYRVPGRAVGTVQAAAGQGPSDVTQNRRLDLDNYLPYLVNRVGFALVDSFTADALKANGLSIDMWRVLA